MEDGGYSNHALWLSEGWDFINENRQKAPLYWHKKEGQWFWYNLNGFGPVDPDVPVQHITFYEAAAFAVCAEYWLPNVLLLAVESEPITVGSICCCPYVVYIYSLDIIISYAQ